MVKSVVGEETRLQGAEDRLFQSAVRAQVGLVIGKLSPGLDRGFVYDIVPTPPTDAGLPPCSLLETGGCVGRDDKKKGTMGGGARSQLEATTALCIDADWVAEHARQVSRMLLGGMHVVGIYVWASESSFKASKLVLWQTIKGVAQAAPFHGSSSQERLLVHASYSPRRWTCRSCILTSDNVSANLHPCDFKLGKLLASLQSFRCMYKFDIRLPILQERNTNAIKDVLQDAIANHAKKLQSGAKALIDGKLVTDDMRYSSEGIHEIELLLPWMNGLYSEASKQGEVIGLVVFRGVIYASAYLTPRDTASEAISEIKGDIITSLQSRLDIISEEAGLVDSFVNDERDAEKDMSNKNINCHHILHNLKRHCTLLFPRRVLIPWLADIFICDYLQPSESFEDLKNHCMEMMSMEDDPIDIKSILEVEREAAPTVMMAKSFWDALAGKSSTTGAAGCSSDSMGGNRGSATAGRRIGATTGGFEVCNLNMRVVAIAVVLLAVLVGWIATRKLTHHGEG